MEVMGPSAWSVAEPLEALTFFAQFKTKLHRVLTRTDISLLVKNCSGVVLMVLVAASLQW